MTPYVSENFKTQLHLHIPSEVFQIFPEMSSEWSSQNTHCGFLKVCDFKFWWDFDIFSLLRVYEYMRNVLQVFAS